LPPEVKFGRQLSIIEAWVTGKWQANKSGTKRYRDVMRKSPVELNFIKVKGHTGVDGNEEADRLEKKAVGVTF
jgi:ribonuclease HI